MELRVLRYFLAIAEEGNITKAAEALHITQPTLSRQLAELEDELGTTLFIRKTRSTSLTEDGRLLRRRAQEMLALHDKAIMEIKKSGEELSGEVFIACGDLKIVSRVTDCISAFRQSFPKVRFTLRTANADDIKDSMARGLTDIGILLDPVNVEDFSYVRSRRQEHFVAALNVNSPLAEKQVITPEDLVGVPLILPVRKDVRAEVLSWFGKQSGNIDEAISCDLPSTMMTLVMSGAGVCLSIYGSMANWDDKAICVKPLKPELSVGSVIAWRKSNTQSRCVSAFLDYLLSFFQMDENDKEA